MSGKNKKKVIIGRKDIVGLPELGIHQIEVKIDTGAYTSSIHCKTIEEKKEQLYCVFLDEKHPEYSHLTYVFSTYNTTLVKSSNGMVQKRYEIKSKMKIFNKKYKITLTLSDRKDMKYPVLIGRKFLNGKFIVDPQQEDLSYNNNLHEYKNTF